MRPERPQFFRGGSPLARQGPFFGTKDFIGRLKAFNRQQCEHLPILGFAGLCGGPGKVFVSQDQRKNLWQFLVCFQARGAPGEGLGRGGGQAPSKTPQTLRKPLKTLFKLSPRASCSGSFPDGPLCLWSFPRFPSLPPSLLLGL